MTENRLINIINTVYETEGFTGVLDEVKDRLVYGNVAKIEDGLYRISTGGWSDDEFLLDCLIHPLSKFHYHLVGQLCGGHFYFCEDKWANVEIVKVKE